MTHEDWDLFAIVRSCKAATLTATTNTETPPTTTTPRSPNTSSYLDVSQENGSFSFPNLVQPRTNEYQELHQLLINFNPTTSTSTITSTITSGLGINPNSTFSEVAGFIGQQQIQQGHHHHLVPAPTNHAPIGTTSTTSFDRFQNPLHQQQQPQTPEQQQPQQNQPTQTSPMLSPTTQPRSRKRKNQQKKMVCHVTADNLSADLWAWRKYGQKPIKGSPYPRNYYRCSSCKGCAARKQVERSTTEPHTFIVTYTGDHKHAKPVHRNSLAGSTRTKPSTTHLPKTHEAVSCVKKENACSSNCELSPISLRPDSSENEETAAAGEPDCPDTEIDHSENDDDDVLIPNTGAMSDAVLLGLTSVDRDGVLTLGIDQNSTLGSTRSGPDPLPNRL